MGKSCKKLIFSLVKHEKFSWCLHPSLIQIWPSCSFDVPSEVRVRSNYVWNHGVDCSVAEKLPWFIRHLSPWALYILFKFVKSLIRHLGLAIGNVWFVLWKFLGFYRTEDRFWPDFASISNMIIHRSFTMFTGPTHLLHLLSANVRGPVSFTVSVCLMIFMKTGTAKAKTGSYRGTVVKITAPTTIIFITNGEINHPCFDRCVQNVSLAPRLPYAGLHKVGDLED